MKIPADTLKTFAVWSKESPEALADDGKRRQRQAFFAQWTASRLAKASRDEKRCLKKMPGIKFKVPVSSDPRKVGIAHAVHQKTAVARRWTAARLEMKSALNMCQQIQRLKSGKLHLAQRDTAMAVKNRRLTLSWDLLEPLMDTYEH